MALYFPIADLPLLYVSKPIIQVLLHLHTVIADLDVMYHFSSWPCLFGNLLNEVMNQKQAALT